MAKARGPGKSPSRKELLARLELLESSNAGSSSEVQEKQLLKWMDAMVHALLDLRLAKYNSAFIGSKSCFCESCRWHLPSSVATALASATAAIIVTSSVCMSTSQIDIIASKYLECNY